MVCTTVLLVLSWSYVPLVVLCWPTPSPLPLLPRLYNATSNLLQRTSRVLNFFPVPVSEECLADDGRRSGTCMNTYECRIQNGQSHGPCALGFGVCCVFTATCGDEIVNNITYFMSPDFPSLTRANQTCSVKVKKMDAEISQIRLDFVHFNLGQPNRQTGVCDTDVFYMLGGQGRSMSICGQNSGQHVYYEVDNNSDTVELVMNLTAANLFRLWEVRISQIEFGNRVPAGCSQFYQGKSGIIQTMNYAINGRHLANQDYNICVRSEENVCSIVYEPCDDNSFKIGPSILSNDDPVGSGAGPLPLSDSMAAAAQGCNDRVIMPCDSEDFLTPQGGPGICDLLHCGDTLCTPGVSPCRIESSIKPFNIKIQFGPGLRAENPEDNLGMCLKYEQVPCS
ncbi:uncharacterized protein LOC128989235 [Macrosteles quadrilineatus]|uniref:uncharacterized protein LOC128989235 n=1 Tax=Macrosteles quadrilineatus TaxID=74068 RepID=UPI0023E1713F|nr:uncharacterized protein LOC128989235 [Macrosteles quadrilineatus]